MVWIVLAADLNNLALSEIILGNPLLAVNRLKLLRNVSADMSGTTSKCTAGTAQQVYRQSHTFLLESSLCTRGQYILFCERISIMLVNLHFQLSDSMFTMYFVSGAAQSWQGGCI